LKRSNGPGVAGAPSCRVQIDASQEGGEFGGGHLDTIGGSGRYAEGPAFESLGPDGHAVAVPIQDLDAIPAFVDEDKEMPGEGIERQIARCKGGKTVERGISLMPLAAWTVRDTSRPSPSSIHITLFMDVPSG
jgi:hypothetical protein